MEYEKGSRLISGARLNGDAATFKFLAPPNLAALDLSYWRQLGPVSVRRPSYENGSESNVEHCSIL